MQLEWHWFVWVGEDGCGGQITVRENFQPTNAQRFEFIFCCQMKTVTLQLAAKQ